jgi:pyruvate dehydrogenase E1 component alpha subunit
VCENNLYMEYTSIHDVTAVEHPAADRASAYGLEPVLIDGNDVDVVYRTAQRALDLARKGGGPSLIEAETYRHGGHSRADPGKYRPDEEVKAWLAKDPLPRYRSRLLELGINAADIEKIEAETNAEIDRATEAARNAPPPPLEIADTDVWADGGSAWRN